MHIVIDCPSWLALVIVFLIAFAWLAWIAGKRPTS